ncbi:MAG: hypothetical protein J2P16_07215 [Mycobacterium sp.]|nr:hypothetical protein [Mycobacterium sp.]
MTPRKRRDDYELAVERVRAYARKIRDGEQVIDSESLDRAADLTLIYNAKRWVDEMAAAGKGPKNRMARGKPVDRESTNQFTIWILEEEGLSQSRTKQLLRVDGWRRNYGHAVQIIPTEWAARPLYALESKGHGDATGEVVAHAAELAEGGTITAAHTKKAVSEYWASLPKSKRRKLTLKQQTESHIAKFRTEVNWLIDHRQFGTLQKQLHWATEQGRAAREQREAS